MEKREQIQHMYSNPLFRVGFQKWVYGAGTVLQMEFKCFSAKPQMQIISTPDQVSVLKILRIDRLNKRLNCTWSSHRHQWEFRTRSKTKYRFGCSSYVDRMEGSLSFDQQCPLRQMVLTGNCSRITLHPYLFTQENIS